MAVNSTVEWDLKRTDDRSRPVVFVSSSVYDKEDMLRQVHSLLASHGYEPWMSFKGSIAAASYRSAFANCIHSVKDADFFTPWYGSGVDTKDSDSISITHQEMREAEGRDMKILEALRELSLDRLPNVMFLPAVSMAESNAVAPVIDESINQSLNGNIVPVAEIVKIQDNLLADPGMRTFADLLINHPGLRRPRLQELTGISRGEIQGLLNRLKSARLVVYLGSKKTGGYFFVNAREIDFDYKMIVRHCYEAEHSPERRLHGGYQAEKVRRLLERLRKDGLIRYEPSENVTSLNHVDFLGFTDLGRELYLENGQIKPLFAI